MSAAPDIEALLAQLAQTGGMERTGQKLRLAKDERPRPQALVLSDWPELAAALPDGGLPRGVVELTASSGLGGATSVALAAVRAAQARGPHTWCAWIDPEATLHAPGVAAAGVDLARMLVVRAPRPSFGKVAVKVVGAGAFDVVVIDADAIAPSSLDGVLDGAHKSRRKELPSELWVRKLALAAEPSGATVLLLTDSSKARKAPWPVALRLELSRPDPETMAVNVAKERLCRVGRMQKVPFVPFTRRAGWAAGEGREESCAALLA